MAWDILDNDDLGADKILTTGTMNALYDNPTAQAKREANTPSFVQVPVVEKLTAASGNWTWPDGVTAATFWICPLYTSDAADDLPCVDLGRPLIHI